MEKESVNRLLYIDMSELKILINMTIHVYITQREL